MAKPLLCRLGVAQVSCNPAYADELVACLQEPAFLAENEKVGLFTIAGLEEVSRLRQSISEQYVAHLNQKIESIVRFAATEGVELLVFPEYSIPAEALPLCHTLSEELGIAVIAGSHVVTVSLSAQHAYRSLELTFEEGAKPVEEHIRQAACIVFVPKQKPVAFVKYVRSKWETCLVRGAPQVPLERFGEILLGKLIESLRHDIRQIQIPAPVPVGHPVQRERIEQIQPKRRAVGINEAAELIGLSKWTIRKYVVERRIFSVKVGRRILIPMETLDKILAEGVPPPKRR